MNPGQKILDIGCGWGGLAIYLAQMEDVQVYGVTLSREQHALAVERAEAAGVSDRVRFELRDYRELDQKFDRIVSVGMFEHVGVPRYDEFFAKVNELMPDDGVMLLHSIGHMSPPSMASPWLRKYIFPGAYAPALSEVFPVVERNRLWVTDCEFLRLHYAFTQVEPITDLNKETREVEVTFYVDPKSRVYVRRVNFNGADAVNDEVFRREMRQFESQRTRVRMRPAYRSKWRARWSSVRPADCS